MAEPLSDCCVCGEWQLRSRLSAIHSKHLNPKCIRFLNTTLVEKYICRRCRVKCEICQNLVTWTHCELQGGGKVCWACRVTPHTKKTIFKK